MGIIPDQPNPLLDPARAKSMFRIMQGIFDFWQLVDAHRSILLGIDRATWETAKRSMALPALASVAARNSLLLRIYHMSGDIYPRDKDIAAMWVQRRIFAEPFWGSHPRQYMLMDKTSCGDAELSRTCAYLDSCYGRWEALRDQQGRLLRCNDELRIAEEPLDTLAQMIMRIQKSWKLSDSVFDRMIGLSMIIVCDVAKKMHVPTQKIIAQMRMITCIDIALWCNVRDEEKISAWMLSPNNHALFGGAPPYYLLLSHDPGIAKVVYAYLRNTSP